MRWQAEMNLPSGARVIRVHLRIMLEAWNGESCYSHTLVLHILSNFISDCWVQTLLISHFFLDIYPRHLWWCMNTLVAIVGINCGKPCQVYRQLRRLFESYPRGHHRLRRYRPGFFGDWARIKYIVKSVGIAGTMTYLDSEIANFKSCKDSAQQTDNFSIRKHGVPNTGNVEVLSIHK